MLNKNEKTTPMPYHFRCPKCGKRLFDSYTLPQERVVVSFKCRNCNAPVVIEMSQKNLMGNGAHRPITE